MAHSEPTKQTTGTTGTAVPPGQVRARTSPTMSAWRRTLPSRSLRSQPATWSLIESRPKGPRSISSTLPT